MPIITNVIRCHHISHAQVVVPNTVVTDTKFAWNIDNIWEEQVFQEPSYGVMLVVSPSSVREGESIATTVRVIEEPDEGDLPPNVKLASCFYEIATNGNFTKPVQFHLQHSIDLASSDWRNLSFVTRRGSRYEFSRDKQLFDPNDNSGVVHISHFSPHQFGIVYNTNDGTQPVTLYAMNLFYKRVGEDSWEVKIIITQNLQPYFEVTCFFYIVPPLVILIFNRKWWLCSEIGFEEIQTLFTSALMLTVLH